MSDPTRPEPEPVVTVPDDEDDAEAYIGEPLDDQEDE